MGSHEAKENGDDEQKWVHDSSVDYKGRTPLRRSTGAWKASLLIIMIEFWERLSYLGISSNLISYLTKGLSPLTMSQFLPSLRPCNSAKCQNPRKIHEVVFFLAIYCVALGTEGYKPCLESFGADQFDGGHSEERKKKMSYFNWWNVATACGLILGVTIIIYAEDNVSWGAAFLILAIVTAICIVTLYLGWPSYRYRLPEGIPFTPLFQVLVAASRKTKLPYPSNPAILYEVPVILKTQGRLLGYTNRLSVWIKCGTTFSILCQARSYTEQKDCSQLPYPTSLCRYSYCRGLILSMTIYDKILVPAFRRITGNERGISILKRIGIGMIFGVIGLSVAAIVERKRLRVAKEEINMLQESGKKMNLPMSVLWLAPQYLILGIADGFSLAGMQEYFYDQVPDSMRNLGIALYLSVLGIGHFLCSFLIILVNHFTDKDGKSWIGKDLNSSRLDNFYWLVASINMLNLCVFVFLAWRHTYKNVQEKLVAADCSKDDMVVELMP
ncbi:hypothetical protein GH714_036405 [Hevea brasiliensis]|uniref:Major facilitator superfamily (MFS) profile domain-containing protein n=1 Tax=Hevea brasiliensis TaxID=3981 RepID=A0A6A6L6T2_HEVBR|nr:hypothetical protein GH714_036405 [Hevea brasiliensis]